MEPLFDTLATPFWCDFQMRRAIAMDPGGTSKVVALIGLDEFSQGFSGSMPSLQLSDTWLLNIFASDDTVLAELKVFANSVEVVGSPPKKFVMEKKTLHFKSSFCLYLWELRKFDLQGDCLHLYERLACIKAQCLEGLMPLDDVFPSGSQWVLYTIGCIRKWRPHARGDTAKACHWFAWGRMGAKGT